MKKILLLIPFLVYLFFSPVSLFAADRGWVIENFQTKFNLELNGELKVFESINVDFGSLQKHGIYRYIPYQYKNRDGGIRYTEIKIEKINVNGNTSQYTTTTENGYFFIKIGDPKRTVSGKQNYQINYTVVGGVSSYESFDEVYANITGNKWPVPIQKSSVIFKLPLAGIIQTACYQGVEGAKESCNFKVESEEEVFFESSRQLEPFENLTVAVGYSKGLVPILTVEAPKNIWSEVFSLFSLFLSVLVAIVGICIVIWVWFKSGRDFWWRDRFRSDSFARAELKPLGGHETIVVEYNAPDHLRPGEIGALLDEKADTIDITATLVDLANRGYLIIAEEAKTWIFGNTDYILSKKEADESKLLKYERELLKKMFNKGDVVSMSSLKKKFYEDLKKIKEDLYQDLVDKKFFYVNPNSVRNQYSIYALVVGMIAGCLIWAGFFFQLTFLVNIGFGLAVVAIFVLIMARFMPRRSALGRQMYTRALGYKMFVERAEKYRQQFFERKNLFNEVLPYAIVFGVTEKFAKAFAQMGLKPEQPGWYTGSAPFNAAVFGASMASFSNSVSSAMASTPSSSGSGGGGFSGGGFGGGGGGSW